jgi:signal transduction histidine kinase
VIEIVVLLGLVTLVIGVGAALVLRLLPTLRLQLVALALLAAVLPLGTVLASGLVMFHMHDDVKILMLSSAAAIASIVGALLLARWILAAIDRLHDSSVLLAGGDLGARAPQEGVRELAELGRSFNQMAAAVEELFDARRQLVAWASHDLRTPLASINAMLEALEDGLVPLDMYLPALRDRVHTLSRLVDDLFELARIDAGALTIDLQDARLDTVIAGCLRGLDAQARVQRVTLEARLSGPLPAVRCAPDKVERVLLNLLTNALHHTPSDGAIAVCVRAEERTVEVSVEDSGSGIKPGSERQMFDRFWRADSSRGSDGAGLGLAIAHGLVEAQGGRIWAENRPEGGARVAFVLPVAYAA